MGRVEVTERRVRVRALAPHMTRRQIAAELGMAYDSVKADLDILDISAVPERIVTTGVELAERRVEVKNLARSMSDHEIANSLGATLPAIKYDLRCLGVQARNERVQPFAWLNDRPRNQTADQWFEHIAEENVLRTFLILHPGVQSVEATMEHARRATLTIRQMRYWLRLIHAQLGGVEPGPVQPEYARMGFRNRNRINYDIPSKRAKQAFLDDAYERTVLEYERDARQLPDPREVSAETLARWVSILDIAVNRVARWATANKKAMPDV